MIRTKFLAVLLGPSGIALFGIYGSITEMVGTMAGLGVGTSGVKQIAEAYGRGNQRELAKTSQTLRRVSVFLGILGMAILILFSKPISQFTFGNTDYADCLTLVSLAVFIGAITNGQNALIQGMRRIADLAKINVLAAVFGTAATIPIIWLWGEKGIVPFLIVFSFWSFLASWWFSRRIRVEAITISWKETQKEVRGLIELGFVIMISSLITAGTFYLVRVLVIRQLGLDNAGLYQAAGTLSSVYAGVILEAMGKDFYPRLSSNAENNEACNQMVNEQVEVGILLGVPGILATITFAPIIIRLFYSVRFVAAIEVLRWLILGVLIRISSWPMGFILLAKGRSKIFFLTELVTNVVHLGLIWVAIKYFDLVGTGIAFFGMNIFSWLLMIGVARHLTGLTWSAKNIRNGFAVLFAVGIAFLGGYILSDLGSLILSILITMGMTAYSVKSLIRIVSPAGYRELFIRFKSRFSPPMNR